MACAAFELEGTVEGVEGVSMEADNTRELADKFSDASANLSWEVNDLGEEVFDGNCGDVGTASLVPAFSDRSNGDSGDII